jgi:lipopolysaccharide/colanic/teichoic acid biosynthesis glycosyltransferase
MSDETPAELHKPIVAAPLPAPGGRYRPVKRVLDVFGAAVGLLVAAAPMAIIAVLVRATMGSPVLFRQARPGLLERPFTILKFRTMREATPSDGRPLADGERLTRLGCVLRRWSLDELPEFYNVLKGDMSLVGPRPLLTHYLPYFRDEERARFRVRPGITGQAQVNGRNLVGWDHRLALDADYVRHLSLKNDLRIVARTVLQVAGSKGVVVDAGSVMLDLDVERSEEAGTRTTRHQGGGPNRE